ncbi:hypothetical protein RSOLAG22IIIB_08928 [Rhizoctonia solani]|uniref:Uncharacterized protein n=1 Tax=Rhizoctonia solani TaxID=456999 RepID=A0A0K6FWG4_9AGAM|nr:hypothetical protein RSOLAG22IIIB_08928 [Rhizoctonia solani]
MPPKRPHPSSSSKSGGTSKKAKVITKSKKVKLRKSNPPNWQTLHPEWSEDMPRGKNARLCIEKWCLLPPYDHEITERHERSALDEANTCGHDIIKVEELFTSPWWLLDTASQNVAAAIYGSDLDEDEKTAIARTIRGSLYFLEVEGADNGGKSRATNKGRAKIFSWTGDKTISGTTAARINSFEPTLFGSKGWLSSLKLYNLLFAAGTDLLYNEDSYPTNPGVASREKFKFFEGETTGGDLGKAGEVLRKELEEEEPEEDLGDRAPVRRGKGRMRSLPFVASSTSRMNGDHSH